MRFHTIPAKGSGREQNPPAPPGQPKPEAATFGRMLPVIDCLRNHFPAAPLVIPSREWELRTSDCYLKDLNVAWFYTIPKKPVNIKVRYILC
jgi:hypothetical protein